MTMFKQCRRAFCCMLASCRGVPGALSDGTIAPMYYEGDIRSHSGIYGPEALRNVVGPALLTAEHFVVDSKIIN